MPKRVGHIWDKICSAENFARAWNTYNKNRKRVLRKPYNPTLAAIWRQELKDGTYDFGVPRLKTIRESGKTRQLRIPSHKAIVQITAIFNYLGPRLEKAVPSRSYSSRKGMGLHKCVNAQRRFLNLRRKDSKYCLYLDVRKCYDHIRHSDVLEAVERVCKDPQVLESMRRMLVSAGPGLPIGYPASHTLCNLVFTPLYYAIVGMKGVAACYVYMDNFTVYSNSKAALRRAHREAERWLAERGMSIKKDWQIFPTAARRVKTCGTCLAAGRIPDLYRRLFRRIVQNIDRFVECPTRALARALASRYGWLLLVGREHLMLDRISLHKLKGALAYE